MKVEILREIVSRVFRVRAQDVRLAKEGLEPQDHFEGSYHDGSCGCSKESVQLHGFSPATGFVNLTAHVGNEWSSNYAHSQSVNNPGTPLCDIPGIEKYIFLIVTRIGSDDWSGREYSSWDTVTVYKLPDFAQHWAAVEAADIARWRQWVEAA